MINIIKKYKLKYVLVIVLTILFEIFICNYQYIRANFLNYQEVIFNELKTIKKVQIDEEKDIEKNIYTVEVKDINEKVNTIYVDYIDKTTYHSEITVNLYYTDDLFSDYERMYGGYEKLSHKITDQYDESKMIYCNFTGNTEKIKLEIITPVYSQIQLNSISINKRPSFDFNYLRVAFIIFFIIAVDVLLNSKRLSKNNDKLNKKENYYLIIISLLFIVILFFMQFTINQNNLFIADINKIYGKDFVMSLLSGNIDINSPPNTLKALNNADNPYDFSEINQLDLDKGFDIAYYKGNTYVYYGILPALIMLIPYYIVTSGSFLTIPTATFLFLSIGILFQIFFMKNIIDRYFNKKIPIKLIMILGLFFLANTKILWVMSRPYTYELVTAAGYCMVMIGLYNFSEYLKNHERFSLFASSFFMALSVACRPTLLLISIIPCAIWIKEIFEGIKNKQIKKNIINILIIFLPYLLVGISLMIYNYIRFENIFEFGANYQVSVTDFRNFGFDLRRVFIGMVAFLFGPLRFLAKFPFIVSENFIGAYNGYYYSQPVGAGFFVMSILGCVILLLPWITKYLKEYNKQMLYLIYLLIGIATFLMAFAANKTGTLGRYMLDFEWLYTMSSILILLFIYTKIKKEKNKKIFIKIILIVTIISLALNIMVLYSNEGRLLGINKNLNIYYFIKDTVCFLK